ncbi:MAG: hypothetical protein NVS3B25_33400 [Hymenobacter sp.]
MSTPPYAITQAIQAYYDQAGALTLTATDFYHWLASLPAVRRAEVMKSRFSFLHQPDFLRYCLERRGHRLPDFLARHLSLADFAQWVASGENKPTLPH